MGALPKTERPRGGGKLAWIEVGRGIAALSVVIAHLYRGPYYLTGPLQFLSPEQFGSYGVEYFFVLSGFIICYVHRRDIGQPKQLGTYAFRRLTRILPTYYLVVAVSLLLNQTLSAPQFRHHIDAVFLLRQIFLLPGQGLFIGVGWTLRHEFLFYGVFALAILSGRLGLIAFLGWMAAVAINFILNGPPPGQMHNALGILLLHYNLDFLIGACIAMATIEGRIRSCTIAMAGLALAIGLWIAVEGASTAATIFLLKAIFATLLCLAVILSLRGLKPWRPLVYLGAISYGLYLTHITTEVIVHAIFKRTHLLPEESLIVFGLSVIASIIVATALYEIFEKPLLRWMHRSSKARRAAA